MLQVSLYILRVYVFSLYSVIGELVKRSIAVTLTLL